MLLAAAGVAVLLLPIRPSRWEWFVWIVLAPIVYLSWVVFYLTLSAVVIHYLGSRYPKPRHFVAEPGLQSLSREDLGVRTAVICYLQWGLVETLPLARATGRIPCLSRLWMRAYSPSLNLGTGVGVSGHILDPDLTEVGDNSVLGVGSVLVAHAMTRREDGAVSYTSARIKIGRRVTLGGQVYIGLGCVIEDNAILQPRAVADPFTHIPAGEVWGGNPATFLRKRTDTEFAQLEPEHAQAAEPIHEASQSTLAIPRGGPGPSSAARDLVIATLQLDPDHLPSELSITGCAEWDSLGQIAIAAALFDRYGIAIEGEEAFRIRTLQDVSNLMSGTNGERPSNGPEDAAVRAAAASPVSIAAAEAPALPDDVEMLPLVDAQEATRALAIRFDSEPRGSQILRLCVAASFTIQPVASALRVWGRAFGFEIECQFADYDQIIQTLVDPEGPFAANVGGVNIVLTRPEDLVPEFGIDSTTRLEDFLNALRSYAANAASPAQLLVGTLPPVVSTFSHVSERLAAELRDRWNTAIEQLPGVVVVEFGRSVQNLGIAQARSTQAELSARAPYSPQLYQALAIELVRSIRGTRRAPAKVILLDCDNTLWGGVVGEVGLKGIQLGPDGAGRSFQMLQRYLKRLEARGILLAVVSKNELSDVLEVFEKHPAMILRSNDIVAWRVNWEPKSKSIRDLADELRLGLDSFVLLDDDPVVRMEVKSLVPDVHVVPLPSDPSQYCETLGRLWLFDAPRATTLDVSRTRMMHEDSRRQKESASAANQQNFLAGLNLQVEIASVAELEWARVAQLTLRTNQFNLSLKRRALEEVRLVAADHAVLVVKAQDKFGDYGLVGVCIFKSDERSGVCAIDTLLMSCRALGRGVEDAFLHGIAAVAARQGASRLRARYVAGPRNSQVRHFLARCGFDEIEPDVFARSLDELPPLPTHIRLNERIAQEIDRTSDRSREHAPDVAPG
jgi:FkbH-like protein